MGWVEDRFRDHVATSRLIVRLWNDVRDSIGESVTEFVARVPHLDLTVIRKDCQAQGRYCQRVEKMTGEYIEIFLDLESKSLKTANPEAVVCNFRLSNDRSRLEFYLIVSTAAEKAEKIINTDDACRRALEGFLFTPFPRLFCNDSAEMDQLTNHHGSGSPLPSN